MTRREALALARLMVHELGKDEWIPEIALVNRTSPRTFEIKARSRDRTYSVTNLQTRGIFVAHALGYVESGRSATEAVQALRAPLYSRFLELKRALKYSPRAVDGSGLVTRRFPK